VVRIDLGDNRCAYGRQLLGSNVEFYDRCGTATDSETVDLLDVVVVPVAFTVWVMNSAFRRNGGWELLDVVPLTAAERTVVDRRFKRDPINGTLTIYQSDPAAGTFRERPATALECTDLEPAAVWSPHHVEDRLRDHFDGRPNKWTESLGLRP
jgi:hypothetical protein